MTQLHRNELGRAPDAVGFNYWTGQLASGNTREYVLVGISESDENKTLTALQTHDAWVFLR